MNNFAPKYCNFIDNIWFVYKLARLGFSEVNQNKLIYTCIKR